MEPRAKATPNTFWQLHGKCLINIWLAVALPGSTCSEMPKRAKTRREQLKWTSKRDKSIVKAVRKKLRGAPAA